MAIDRPVAIFIERVHIINLAARWLEEELKHTAAAL